MISKGVVFLAAFLAIGLVVPGYCGQDDGTHTITGNITEIDWAASSIVVQGYDGITNIFYETTIKVPDDAIMKKGTDSVGMADLEISDYVSAKFTEDSNGDTTLIRLDVFTH